MEEIELYIDGINYSVILNSLQPLTYQVSNAKTLHIIGKKQDGEWIAIRHRPLSQPIPIEQIGKEIDKLNE